jgi:hypothetical protein
MSGHPWPDTIYQSFSSWGDGLELPPQPAGRHMILLAYYKREPGRLFEEGKRGAPLRVKVIDQTNGQDVRLLRNWEYSTIGPYEDWEVEEIAQFMAIEGHCYKIEVDPDQVKELGRYRHRLGVDLTQAEKMNWKRRK